MSPSVSGSSDGRVENSSAAFLLGLPVCPRVAPSGSGRKSSSTGSPSSSQQADFRRIDGAGTDAAARLIIVLQTKLVAHHDAIGRLCLQRLVARGQHEA